MSNSSKKIDIDFEKILNNIKSYFVNLTQYAMYSWIVIGVGVLLVIASFIV